MTQTYPATFAATIWQPFAVGSAIFEMIADCSSTFEQFTATTKESDQGVAYSTDEMASLWTMVQRQKRRTAAFYLVSTGQAVALNPALAMLS